MANAIPQRQVGTTDVHITTLGFGGNVLGNLYAAVPDDVAKDTVRAAQQSGVNYFDTAPLYGHGLSERRLGDALRALPRESFVLSTKVGRLLKPHGRVPPPKLKPSEGGIFVDELQFVLGHASVATVIPGAKSRAEAEQNARWMTLPIPAAFWAELKAAGLVRSDAPTGGL